MNYLKLSIDGAALAGGLAGVSHISFSYLGLDGVWLT
jgi:hypothetical protein|tara:strand:+ start:875 stop:985 length:111 start_codon:yes stop_codon:yes gene_type:complete